MTRTPTYYIPHGGGPCFFMDWSPPDTWNTLGAWLRALPSELETPPVALLVVSAHWVEEEFTILSKPEPELFYDYYGFPEHTYELSWPAPGAPEFLPKLRRLLDAAGIPYASDPERDFDHGVFIPGLLSFPQADVPVLQISLRSGFDPAAHLALGEALAPLRDEGVLIVGSGMSFHNMRVFHYGDNDLIPSSEEFDVWLREAVAGTSPEERARLLTDWERAPGGRFAHPYEDHLLPLMVTAGAAGTDTGAVAFSCRAMGAPLVAFRFG